MDAEAEVAVELALGGLDSVDRPLPEQRVESLHAGSLANADGQPDLRWSRVDDYAPIDEEMDHTFSIGGAGQVLIRFRTHINPTGSNEVLRLEADGIGGGNYRYFVEGRTGSDLVDGEDSFLVYKAGSQTRHNIIGEINLSAGSSGGRAGLYADIGGGRFDSGIRYFRRGELEAAYGLNEIRIFNVNGATMYDDTENIFEIFVQS